MASYLDLQTAIANDLTRSDLTSQIQSAIQDAIAQYETDRFWFNTTRSLTFNTVPTQPAYTATDLAQLANVVQIDKLFIKNGLSTYPITYEEPDQFEYLTSLVNTSGLPFCWTYVDSQLLLYPTPLQVYVMRPHMHYRLSALVNPTDTNAWCNEGQKLIKAHAKLILYADLLEDNDGVQRMQLQIPSIKMKLDSETSKKGSSGKIRSTNF